MDVTVLAMGLLLTALVGDLVGAFIPGRLICNSSTDIGYAVHHQNPCTRYRLSLGDHRKDSSQ